MFITRKSGNYSVIIFDFLQESSNSSFSGTFPLLIPKRYLSEFILYNTDK